MKIYFISAFFIISTIVLNATVIIDGRVLDNNGLPIPNVSVRVSEQDPTVSDTQGYFRIVCPVDSSSVLVSFTCVGYNTKNVRLYKGEKNIEIVLFDHVIPINEVTVQSTKYSRFSNYAAQIIKMNPFDIYTNPQALGDILGSMTVMPGVQRNDNNGRLIIQGGATDETQIYVDGLMLFNPYSLEQKNVSVRSRFSPDLFNGVSLQSAGYGAQFGNALSGILQLNTLEKENMTEKIDLNISSVSVESTLIKKIKKKSSIRANLSYMNLTPYGKIVKDGYKWHKYFNQYAADVFMVNQLSERIKIKSHVFYSQSGVAYSYHNVSNANIRNNLHEDNFLASVVADIPLSTVSSLYAGFNFAHNRFTGTDVSLIDDYVKDIRGNSHQKIAYSFKTNNITNSVGIENVLSDLNESYMLDTLYLLKYRNNQIAVYDEFSVLRGKFNWNFGVRGEYSTYLKTWAISPRMYVGYKMSERNIFSLSLGKYDQLPNEKYLKFTNRIGYNKSAGATLTYVYANILSKFQMDAYWKKYSHLTTFDKVDFYYGNIANGGKGYVKGINVFWKNTYKYADYWLSYGYVDADILNEQIKNYRTPSYLSNHTFNATFKYWVKSVKTMIGSSFHIDAGAVHYAEIELQTGRKTPYRSRLDLSLSFVPTTSVIIHASCQNVLGRKNIYGYEYTPDGSAVRELSTPSARFFYIGVFITLGKSNINQLKAL
ncbi:MAG: TonB-dependent receptor [Prevotellaceae bacterium]|jgi:hypothetical protein|nr:TonB-dependent receptor [Prevotellaceae bacterium]